MKEFSYVITDPQGIHARPAGALVKEAGQFESNIMISKDGKEVDAKRIFGIMGLAAKQGQTIVIRINGSDENEAMQKLSAFMKKNM